MILSRIYHLPYNGLFKTEIRVFTGNRNIVDTTRVFILYCERFQVFILACISVFYNVAGIDEYS